jgi:hypothetical protein
MMVGILCIYGYILMARIPYSHEVVETYTCLHDDPDSIWIMLHGGQEDLEPIGKDTKCIFYNAPTSREPVVEYSLFFSQVAVRERLHQRGHKGKGIVTQDVLRHVIGKRLWLRESNAAIFKGFP